MQLTDARTLVYSLQSTLCPACAKKKKRAQTFCGGCYHGLPYRLKRDLYNPVGDGYELAVAEALDFLEVVEPHWGEAENSGN